MHAASDRGDLNIEGPAGSSDLDCFYADAASVGSGVKDIGMDTAKGRDLTDRETEMETVKLDVFQILSVDDDDRAVNGDGTVGGKGLGEDDFEEESSTGAVMLSVAGVDDFPVIVPDLGIKLVVQLDDLNMESQVINVDLLFVRSSSPVLHVILIRRDLAKDMKCRERNRTSRDVDARKDIALSNLESEVLDLSCEGRGSVPVDGVIAAAVKVEVVTVV